MSTDVAWHAREVGDLPAEALRIDVTTVRARGRHEGTEHQHPDREHVDDAREVAHARRDHVRRGGPSGSLARLWIINATATNAIASRKCPITLTHASLTSTEIPPSTALPR